MKRVFRDGADDSDFRAGTARVAKFDLEVDEFGNSLWLSGLWFHVLTAQGESHPGVPDLGLNGNGEAVVPGPDGTWYLDGGRSRLVSLPSGNILWERASDWEEDYQRTNAVANQAGVARTFFSEEFPYAYPVTSYSVLSVWQSSLVDPEEKPKLLYAIDHSLDDPTFYVETALLAINDGRRYLGTTAYDADPDTHLRIGCRESMLINIDDLAWKPSTLGFCGALEAIELGNDGALYSLWTVPVETLDAAVHPFEAEATLVRHAPDGTETGRWVLTDTFGRLAQDGSGAMDMKLVDGGKAAVIGALVGGPWNGRFFTRPSKRDCGPSSARVARHAGSKCRHRLPQQRSSHTSSAHEHLYLGAFINQACQYG